MNANCIFCKIVAAEIPAHKVYEDEKCLVFLDIFPLMPGHALLIPKQHEPDFWSLDRDLYRHCLDRVQTMATHMKSILEPKKVGLIVSGFDVPHTHFHLIPLNSEKELTTESLKARNLPFPTAEELAKMAEKLRMTMP